MATFTSTSDVMILAELADGKIIQCRTTLKADGDYREWYEPAPVEWMYGWTESEQYIDEESITVLDSMDYTNCNSEEQSDFAIKKIIEIIEEIEWEVNEDWEEDFQPDWDAIAKEQKLNEVA